MNLLVLTILTTCLYQSFVCVFALSVPPLSTYSPSRRSCPNSPTSRSCWGEYSIDTDYDSITPHTGVTREYWLSAENITLALDGFERQVLAFNGTIPGPTIHADWGDNLVIHVTNNMKDNGTTVHWHGLRQLHTNHYDGVPGVTQCPIAPGQTFTYRFQATQYGSTWYHSHINLQYTDGLYGPLTINGPATSNYDEDLGMLFLSDWSHKPISSIWEIIRGKGQPSLENGLINGTNTYDCSKSKDPRCTGKGKKFETVFKSGRKYRIGLVNVATNGHFQFSIDGHSLTVIANDLVPIVPYSTDSVLLNMGQRYDIIVEADAKPGDYWLRAGWQSQCTPNNNPDGITGIVRYNAESTTVPTTTGIAVGDSCGDEPLASLVPHLALDVDTPDKIVETEIGIAFDNYLLWTINGSTMHLDWTNPTNLRVFNNESTFPTNLNIMQVETPSPEDEYEVMVLEDKGGIPVPHPIHLHGHDFWILSQGSNPFSCSDTRLHLKNPPRRDTVSLPAGGHLVVAFKKANAGAWLLHCHDAWHNSQGFALQMLAFQNEMIEQLPDTHDLGDLCIAWKAYTNHEVYAQDDAGV